MLSESEKRARDAWHAVVVNVIEPRKLSDQAQLDMIVDLIAGITAIRNNYMQSGLTPTNA